MNQNPDPKAASLNPMAFGCVTVIGIVIIAIAGATYFVYTRGKTNQEALAAIAQQLEELRLAFPFAKSQAQFDPDAFDRVLRVRQDVSGSLQSFFGLGEGGSSSLDAIPESGRALIASLENARMSPDLYSWYGHHVAAACLLGKEGDPRFRRLWNGLEDLMANPKSNPSYLIESLTKRSARVEVTTDALETMPLHVDRMIDSLTAFLADDFVLANQFTESSQKKADPKKVDLLRRPPRSDG